MAEVKTETKPEPVVQQVPKLPTENPWVAPYAVCRNRGCYRILQPEVFMNKAGAPDLVYVCPNCLYKIRASLKPIDGECVALAKEEIEKVRARKGWSFKPPASEKVV